MNGPARGREHIKSDNIIIGRLYGLCLMREDGARERLVMTDRQPNQQPSQAGRTKLGAGVRSDGRQ
jgi:hypothetical protein